MNEGGGRQKKIDLRALPESSPLGLTWFWIGLRG